MLVRNLQIGDEAVVQQVFVSVGDLREGSEAVIDLRNLPTAMIGGKMMVCNSAEQVN